MIVSVMYPATGKKFDLDYYLNKHVPMVQSLWGPLGLKGAQVLKGTGAPAGDAAYQLIALLEFGSLAQFQEAVKQHGKQVMGDIPNFTDVQPAIQFNEPPR